MFINLASGLFKETKKRLIENYHWLERHTYSVIAKNTAVHPTIPRLHIPTNPSLASLSINLKKETTTSNQVSRLRIAVFFYLSLSNTAAKKKIRGHLCVCFDYFFVYRKIEDIEVSGYGARLLISSLTGNRDFCLYVTYCTSVRISNDYRGPCRRSCGRMIWLLCHPPCYVSKLSLFPSLPVCRRLAGRTYWRERGGRVRSQNLPRESLVLYKSFDTLWCTPR
jgi:hypothetical protein